ncbi:MAG TPA: hypothetical protein VJ824_09045 [Bacillota bacterium]|nr:hypothetical protein [Bacillota bacterium]
MFSCSIGSVRVIKAVQDSDPLGLLVFIKVALKNTLLVSFLEGYFSVS